MSTPLSTPLSIPWPIPFPFTVSLVLVFLLAQLTWREGVVVQANQRFRQLLGGYALLSVLVGLRWGHGIVQVAPLQATLAVGLAAWAWCCYHRVAGGAQARPWLHLLPALGVVALAVAWPAVPGAVGAALVLAYLGYGLALWRLARRMPVGAMRRRVGLVAGGLLLSALAEAGLAGGLAHRLGPYSGWLLGGWQMLALLAWGAAASAVGSTLADRAPEPFAD